MKFLAGLHCCRTIESEEMLLRSNSRCNWVSVKFPKLNLFRPLHSDSCCHTTTLWTMVEPRSGVNFYWVPWGFVTNCDSCVIITKLCCITLHLWKSLSIIITFITKGSVCIFLFKRIVIKNYAECAFKSLTKVNQTLNQRCWTFLNL